MKSPITFGSLFAGIGGFDLGFERAGMVCKFQVEIDPFCRRVLAKHWPDVRRHDDVRTFPPTDPGEWAVDVICGGFPCQDISHAGTGKGLDGERSGLWAEYARIARVVRPRFVVVENSSALLFRGMGTVLGDLADSGFDAEWAVLSACMFGAPHTRERLFIVAHANEIDGPQRVGRVFDVPSWIPPGCRSEVRRKWVDAASRNPRNADGVPDRVDRLGGCGNAVVPAVAEWIGKRIVAASEGSA